VLSFGANLTKEPSYEDVVRPRDLSICRLLFLGVDWERKGGKIALETLQLLTDAGIKAELTVCGCVPPTGVSHPKVTVIPFLSKRDPVQMERLVSLLRASTFLILPTRADAAPIVFCEASAFGLPSIARDTGGVGGVVEDGINGYKVAPQEGAEAYAKLILDVYGDRDRYRRLCITARQAYERRLNWDAWGLGARRVLESVVT